MRSPETHRTGKREWTIWKSIGLGAVIGALLAYFGITAWDAKYPPKQAPPDRILTDR